MKPNRIEAVVFDLDGTLVHSAVDYAKMRTKVIEILVSKGVKEESLKDALRLWQLMHESEMQLEEMGYGAKERTEILANLTCAMNEVELEGVEKTTSIEGAKDVLMKLKEMGIKIGIATRGCGAYARETLRKTGLIGFVDILLARDEVTHSKPDPRHLIQVINALGVPLDAVVFVGDTATDFQTAKDASVTFLGFSQQAQYIERLRNAGCETIMEDLTQLIDFLPH